MDSHSISVIYYRTRFISVASANRVCSLTHAKGKKKTLAHFVPTHSPRTPPQLCTLSSTAVGGGSRSRSKRHRISPPQLYTSSTSIAAATLSSTAIVGGRKSRSKRRGISPLLLSAAYLHRHSRLWSTGVFCGIGPGIFLMEKVINLISEIFTHLLSQSVRRC